MSNKHLLCIKLYSRCHEVGAANMPTFFTITQARGAVCRGRAATGIPVTSPVSPPTLRSLSHFKTFALALSSI